MKEVLVDELLGNEILAVPVMSSNENILIQSDTMLRQEYIRKLTDLGVESVYIKDREELRDEQIGRIRKHSDEMCTIEQTFEESMDVVESILSKHIYKHNEELKRVSEEADIVINKVISEPEVIEQITEIRNISTDMYSHCLNVCILSTIMAMRLKMNEKQVQNVSKGAILHDIGLKYINVPYIGLSPDEMNPEDALEYKKHTVYGYSSIQEEEWLADPVKEIILLHHEQMDGEGFPFRQNGDKLRNEVRLVALCDTFDALISGIGDKKVKMYEAIEYIRAYTGTKFDPTIARKFLETVAMFPVGSQVVLSSGETGEVVKQNKDALDRPVVKVVTNADGSSCEEEKEIDLVKALTLFIVDTL